jgi:AcrR family transcriptional regulator
MILTGQFYSAGFRPGERGAMARRDKRQEIMLAAEKLSSTRRFHEITTDQVAEAARVGKGTIYRYFQDKDDLFFQTAVSGFDSLCDLVRRKVPEAAPFHEQLLEACREIGTFFARRRQLFRMMQAEDFRMALVGGSMMDRWVAHRKQLVAAVADVIRKGVAEKAVRGDLPPEVLADFLLGMLRTRARDLEDAPEAVRRYEVVLDLFYRGASSGDAANAAAPPGRGARRKRGVPCAARREPLGRAAGGLSARGR